MSRTYSAIKNKHKKQSKVHYDAFLYYDSEPQENISDGTPAELQAELLDDNVSMRHEFRHLANRMRSR